MTKYIANKHKPEAKLVNINDNATLEKGADNNQQ